MIGYQDKTFCPFHESCIHGLTCERALTDKVTAAADKWWGEPGAPIYVYSEAPKCHEKKDSP